MNIKPLSFSKLKTVPLADRQSEADEQDFGAPYQAGGTFADFLCSLPGLGAAEDIITLRDAIATAYRRGRSVIIGCGGHVMDTGLSPILVRLLEQRIISGVAMTGAALLQDVEIALSGRTTQCRDQELQDGHFCVTKETGELINEAINFGAIEGWGMGRSVGQKLLDLEPEHLDHSVLATACRYGIPVTVHPAIGADAFNLHPKTHGESLGAVGFTDFRLLSAMMAEASGGVLINVASSVVLPRVFLQAVDAARNLGNQVEGLTTVAIDSTAGPTVSDVV
ncbi:MAG TPA: hypothetical protein VJ961_05185, partial [Mariprofundaceae bacterium]|nr:hypothetical protein [Mariprofundaceae bacterium]